MEQSSYHQQMRNHQSRISQEVIDPHTAVERINARLSAVRGLQYEKHVIRALNG